MKITRKKAVAAGTTVAVLGTAGIAFAYWTTTGSGSGTGTTTDPAAAQLSFDQDALSAMYPGDSAQPLKVTVTNDATESAYVSTVTAYITTDKAGCNGDDFLIDGAAAPGGEAGAVPLAWDAQDLAGGDSANATGTIQFNNKAGAPQDVCRDAVVTVHYLAS